APRPVCDHVAPEGCQQAGRGGSARGTITRKSGSLKGRTSCATSRDVIASLAVTTTAAGAAGSNTLTVKAGEYTYQLKGSPKGGLTKIDFDNAGVENH